MAKTSLSISQRKNGQRNLWLIGGFFYWSGDVPVFLACPLRTRIFSSKVCGNPIFPPTGFGVIRHHMTQQRGVLRQAAALGDFLLGNLASCHPPKTVFPGGWAPPIGKWLGSKPPWSSAIWKGTRSLGDENDHHVYWPRFLNGMILQAVSNWLLMASTPTTNEVFSETLGLGGFSHHRCCWKHPRMVHR